jgi:exosortase
VRSTFESFTAVLSGRNPGRQLSSSWYSFALVCLAAAHLPFLVIHAQFLWLRPHYQFFPFVPLGAALLAYDAYRRNGPYQVGSRSRSLCLVYLSWFLLTASLLLFSPLLGALASLVTLLGVIHGVGGRTLVTALLPAWAFLWLIIPPPFGDERHLILLLQRLVSACNGPVLDLLGVRHYMEGNVVVVAGHTLLIGETCSGILSLLPIMTFTLFLVLWNHIPPTRAVILLIAAAFWDIVVNIVRVAAIAFFSTTWEIDLSSGLPHEALGIVVFGFTLALIASTDRLVKYLTDSARYWKGRLVEWWILRKDREHWDLLAPLDLEVPLSVDSPVLDAGVIATTSGTANPITDVDQHLPPDLSRSWLSSIWIFAVYGLFGLLALPVFGPSTADMFRAPSFARSFASLRTDSLPDRWESFQRTKFEPMYVGSFNGEGNYCRAWYYQWGAQSPVVVLDYPFRGWHELPGCYQTRGWKLSDETVLQEQLTVGGGTMTEVTFTQPQGRYGYLLFSICDEAGESLKPSPLSDIAPTETWLARLSGKLVGHDHPKHSDFTRSFQLQLFLASDSPLNPAERTEARAFFAHAHQIIRQLSKGSLQE